MKVNWNTKYTTISVYSFIVVSSIIVFYLALSQIGAITGKISEFIQVLQPFIIGFSIAYLLNFVLYFYESKVLEYEIFKKMKLKSKRGLALLLTYITAFIVLGLFIQFVLPQLVDSIIGLANDIPGYITNGTKMLEEAISNLDLGEEFYTTIVENINSFINYIIKLATNLIPVMGGMLATIASSIWNIILGIIISVYMLIDKERFFGLSKKVIYAFLSEEKAEKVIELTHRSNLTFGKFLSGKILDSTIIGVLTFIILKIFDMPYSLLVSVIIGVTNVIPFFGPFIGAIPSFIIILFISPTKALWFILIVLIIQQIDGNIIGPKILGDSIGISAFWILFSIMIAGKLLGFVGMIIGVPLFAVIYSLIKEVVEERLRNKGLKTNTSDYIKDKIK